MYDDFLDEFNEQLDELLHVQMKDQASFKVGKVLYEQLTQLAENFDQARFLFSNVRVAVSEDIYKGNELLIEDMIGKFAHVMVRAYNEYFLEFGEDVARAVFTKFDMHFALET